MKTANLAIVFTDIKGFTERTSAQTLEENQRLLARHNELLAPLFKAFGGRIIKSIGDAFLVTFESPTQAVLSGLAIQDRLWAYNRNAPEREQFHIRVAINVGEVRLEANDVFGEPVNIAARVEGITDADEVYFTEAVFLSMNKAEVPAEEVGSFDLKGIPGKIRVYRVPKGPYRVASAEPASDPLPNEFDNSQPPFGNLALARVMPEMTPGRPLIDLNDVSVRAAALGAGLQKATQSVISDARSAERRNPWVRKAAMGAGGLVVLALLGSQFLGSKVSRAISDVASAPANERSSKYESAQKLIRAEKDPGERALSMGELELAMGRPGPAASQFGQAARAGNEEGAERLIELLESPECEVRSDAARMLGGLKWKDAKGELEDLAEEGGEGEGGGGLFGCDSKDAAADALRRLE